MFSFSVATVLATDDMRERRSRATAASRMRTSSRRSSICEMTCRLNPMKDAGLHLGEAVGARVRVDHAQGADRDAIRRDERRPRVEAKVWIVRDEGVFARARVERQVRDDEQILACQRVRADGLPDRRLASLESDPRLEPLTFPVDEADQGDRRLAALRRDEHDIVEAGLRRRVEDVVAGKRDEALGLAIRVVERNRLHRTTCVPC